MLLELTHETTFLYDQPVSEVYMEFRLTPLTDGAQHLLQHRQRVAPLRPVRQYVDAFGSTVSYFNLLNRHEKIEVYFDSVVETFPSASREGGSGEARPSAPGVLLYDYLRPTPLTEPCGEFLEFVRPLEHLRGESARQVALAVSDILYTRFRYEGEVTSASSPIADILRHGGGVCQDFAHLMLATCRWLGYPSRYVSGYVLTQRDEESPAASHAWCQVYDPESGWIGIDPTHNALAGEQYVRLGVGRDYKDVPPNKGVFRGHGTETMEVRVHLRAITVEELNARARTLYPQPRGPQGARGARRQAPASLTQQTLTQHLQQQQQQ